MSLVLSIFPGIGMFDMAFEHEGFCVVRGPDKWWGGDIKRFHPPAGRFDGLIGGDPCQGHSSLAHLNRAQGAFVEEDFTPEFERCVVESDVEWFVRENSPFAPLPKPAGYYTSSEIVCDHWVGGATQRKRRFCWGIRSHRRRPGIAARLKIDFPALHAIEAKRAVTGDARQASVGERVRNKARVGNDGGVLPSSGKVMSLEEMLVDQGLPTDFFGDTCPFTLKTMKKMIGNGVPLPMGRAIARAVKAAISQERAA